MSCRLLLGPPGGALSSRLESVRPVLAFACLVLVPRAWCDVLLLANGDRLSGEVLAVIEERVRVRYRTAVLSLRRSEISQLNAPGPFLATLPSGETVRGALSGGGEGGLRVGLAPGRRVLRAHRVEDVDSSSDLPEVAAKAPQEATSLQPDEDDALAQLEQDLFGQAPTAPGQWTGNFALSLGALRGNSHQTSARGRLEARRRSEHLRRRVVLESEQVAAQGSSLQNRSLAELRLVRIGGTRLLGGATLRILTDELREIDLRKQLSLDLGRAWRGNREAWVEYRLSLAYATERRDSGLVETELGLQATLAARRTYGQGLRWEQRLEFFPDLRSGNARALSSTKLSVPAGRNLEWISDLRLRYDSGAPRAVEDLDLTFLTGLERSF